MFKVYEGGGERDQSLGAARPLSLRRRTIRAAKQLGHHITRLHPARIGEPLQTQRVIALDAHHDAQRRLLDPSSQTRGPATSGRAANGGGRRALVLHDRESTDDKGHASSVPLGDHATLRQEQCIPLRPDRCPPTGPPNRAGPDENPCKRGPAVSAPDTLRRGRSWLYDRECP